MASQTSPANRKPLDLLTWSITRRPMLKEGAPFDLVKHFYLRDLYACTAQVMVVNKASQMGASELAVSYVLHAADERDATCLYLFPTDAHVSDFSSARFGPAIESSEYLASLVVDGAGSGGIAGAKKRGADRVTLKRVRNRFVYLRGSQVKPNGQAPQLKSIDADVVVFDEVDEMDPRAPAIGVKRLGHSAIAEQRWISTPTYANFGIHAQWLKSDQRLWFVRCEHCGNRQPMTIKDLVTESDSLGRPVHWHGQAQGQPFIACRKCGKPLDRLARGEWVATAPGREIAGFHLTKLFSPLASLQAIIDALNTADETKRREALNQDLGETYTPTGGKLTEQDLDGLRRGYGHGPVLGDETYAGIDVGKLLHVVIRGALNLETGERPQRFAGAFESFEAAERVLKQYKVRRAVIDAMPETRAARKLQERFRPGVVWLAYYVGQAAGVKSPEPENWDVDNGVVNLDRTRTLDQMYADFYDQINTLPGYARDIPDYYAHLVAPVRTIESKANGDQVATYIEGNEPDHYAHAENYCRVASKHLPLPQGGTWGRKKQETR